VVWDNGCVQILERENELDLLERVIEDAPVARFGGAGIG
jgi:hypothetical protein